MESMDKKEIAVNLALFVLLAVVSVAVGAALVSDQNGQIADYCQKQGINISQSGWTEDCNITLSDGF